MTRSYSQLNKSVIGNLLIVAATLAPWYVATAQELYLRDISPSGVTADELLRSHLSADVQKVLSDSIKAHDFARVEELLVKEIDRNPKSPQLLTLAGTVFFLDRKFLNSAIAMKKAEALAPLDNSSRFTLAMAYVTLNHRDWARPELERLARTDANNPLYPYWLSRLDYDAMHFTSALTHAQKALALNSRFMKAYDQLGLCYEALGKYDKAIAAYRGATALNDGGRPCSPWPFLDLATLLTKLGRPVEAEELLKNSLRCDPNLARAHYQLGLVLEKQIKDEAAIAELDHAAALDPTLPEPHYALGQIYARRGDSQKSKAAWDTFQKLKQSESHQRPH